jgi:flagellar hook-length control protein FliK
MTGVKNSPAGLPVQQIMDAGKKEEKAADEISGFKTMLKSKSQKKTRENSESIKDENNQNEGLAGYGTNVNVPAFLDAGSQAAAFFMSGKVPEQEIPGNQEMQPVFPQNVESVQMQVSAPVEPGNSFCLQSPADQGKEVTVGFMGSKRTAEDGIFIEKNSGMPEQHMGFSARKELVSSEFFGQKEIQAGEHVINVDSMEKKSVTAAQDADGKPAIVVSGYGKPEKKAGAVQKNHKNPEEDQLLLQQNVSKPVYRFSVQPEKNQISEIVLNGENQEVLEEKLSGLILKSAEENKADLDIQLEPRNLGKIRIKISCVDHQVSVSVLCSESRTLKLLSKSAGELGAVLESSLDRPVQIVVDQQGEDYLNQQKGQNEGNQQHKSGQENRKEKSREDFIQKLRLGIFETAYLEEMERI